MAKVKAKSKKPASPAQIAARQKFAEMARMRKATGNASKMGLLKNPAKKKGTTVMARLYESAPNSAPVHDGIHVEFSDGTTATMRMTANGIGLYAPNGVALSYASPSRADVVGYIVQIEKNRKNPGYSAFANKEIKKKGKTKATPKHPAQRGAPSPAYSPIGHGKIFHGHSGKVLAAKFFFNLTDKMISVRTSEGHQGTGIIAADRANAARQLETRARRNDDFIRAFIPASRVAEKTPGKKKRYVIRFDRGEMSPAYFVTMSDKSTAGLKLDSSLSAAFIFTDRELAEGAITYIGNMHERHKKVLAGAGFTGARVVSV